MEIENVFTDQYEFSHAFQISTSAIFLFRYMMSLWMVSFHSPNISITANP